MKKSASPIISCNNITHYYGDRLIYKDLSFTVEQGSILGLLGKNGTGKTTIINILNGFLKPHSGVCSIFGEHSNALQPQTKARIGLLLEGHVQHNFFNVIEIEKFYAPFYAKWNRDVYFELIEKLHIDKKQKLSSMSCGQRSQVALGLVFAQNPDLLILDDFSMGLDPGYRRLFIEFLKDFVTATHKTVFITSHIIQDMEMLIDDCIILDYGKIATHQLSKDLIENFRKHICRSNIDLSKLANDQRVYSLERRNDSWEFCSFGEDDEIRHMLDPFGIVSFDSQQLSLEDVFIGMTGKY